MLLQIPDVLSAEQVAAFRVRIDKAQWEDGNATSGHQSAQVKYNEQLPEASVEAREIGDAIVAALGRNPLFFSAALPRQVYPPLFNRYHGNMNFGKHVDGAVRVHAPTGRRHGALPCDQPALRHASHARLTCFVVFLDRKHGA